MSNSSSKHPTEPTPASPRAKTKNWPLWLGVGFFGLVGVALLVSLANLMGSSEELPAGAAAPDAAPVEASPPADSQEHQALVTEVVDDLGREVLIGDSPTKGNPDADIVLYKFSDFQCAYCSRATTEVDAFMADHEADVLFVYKHLPLMSIHPEAVPSALASWAAGQQDQFWEFHDALFVNQADLGEDLYVRTATELGLDVEQFNRDRASDEAKTAIARDLALVQELQIGSTPTFIMGDMLIPGAVESDVFAEALNQVRAAQ
ncbi:MAG: thioredoxin domain-containing protein [Leptolyngbya sp. SIOISBB]|nr:thioredoxin domain-containing protein [Leptolyngbya sp. SIOISBB]